jgi:hypothetical protein
LKSKREYAGRPEIASANASKLLRRFFFIQVVFQLTFNTPFRHVSVNFQNREVLP